MVEAPVSATPAVADWQALRLAIMCARLAVTLLLWLFLGGRKYDVGVGQLGLKIKLRYYVTLLKHLAVVPPRHRTFSRLETTTATK